MTHIKYKKILNEQERIERTTYCCARVNKNLIVKDEALRLLNENISKEWMIDNVLDARWSTIRDDNYYPLNYPLDYAHMATENMHVSTVGEGGEYIEEPTDMEKGALNDSLGDDICDDYLCGGTVRMKYFFLVSIQDLREKIILRELKEIRDSFIPDLKARYLDLLLAIPREVEKNIPSYIDMLLHLFAEKYPKLKLRTSISVWDGDSISASCSILWRAIIID